MNLILDTYNAAVRNRDPVAFNTLVQRHFDLRLAALETLAHLKIAFDWTQMHLGVLRVIGNRMIVTEGDFMVAVLTITTNADGLICIFADGQVVTFSTLEAFETSIGNHLATML